MWNHTLLGSPWLIACVCETVADRLGEHEGVPNLEIPRPGAKGRSRTMQKGTRN